MVLYVDLGSSSLLLHFLSPLVPPVLYRGGGLMPPTFFDLYNQLVCGLILYIRAAAGPICVCGLL